MSFIFYSLYYNHSEIKVDPLVSIDANIVGSGANITLIGRVDLQTTNVSSFSQFLWSNIKKTFVYIIFKDILICIMQKIPFKGIIANTPMPKTTYELQKNIIKDSYKLIGVLTEDWDFYSTFILDDLF